VTGTLQRRATVALTVAMVVVLLMSACAGPVADKARALTDEEAGRVATMRLNAYRSKNVAFSAILADADVTIRITGWLDTVNHQGYGLVTPPQGQRFLILWDAETVSAQDFAGTTPPLPSPPTGWESTGLRASDSVLAAAQLLLISLSNDRADNPQLLIQNGAQWQRSDTVDGDRVDVVSGPLSNGATVSNLRYWVDDRATLRKLEARLDGHMWSAVTFTAAPGIAF